MRRVRVWMWLCFLLGCVLVGLYFLGESPAGQRYLIGNPSQDHWIADDQAMGAGLAPLVYCLMPGVLLVASSCILYFVDRRRSPKAAE